MEHKFEESKVMPNLSNQKFDLNKQNVCAKKAEQISVKVSKPRLILPKADPTSTVSFKYGAAPVVNTLPETKKIVGSVVPIKLSDKPNTSCFKGPQLQSRPNTHPLQRQNSVTHITANIYEQLRKGIIRSPRPNIVQLTQLDRSKLINKPRATLTVKNIKGSAQPIPSIEFKRSNERHIPQQRTDTQSKVNPSVEQTSEGAIKPKRRESMDNCEDDDKNKDIILIEDNASDTIADAKKEQELIMLKDSNNEQRSSSGLIIKNAKGETVNISDLGTLKFVVKKKTVNNSVKRATTNARLVSTMTIPYTNQFLNPNGGEHILIKNGKPIIFKVQSESSTAPNTSITEINNGEIIETVKRSASESQEKTTDSITDTTTEQPEKSTPLVETIKVEDFQVLLEKVEENQTKIFENTSESENLKMIDEKVVPEEDSADKADPKCSSTVYPVQSEEQIINHGQTSQCKISKQNFAENNFASDNSDELVELAKTNTDSSLQTPPPTVTTPSLFCDEKLENLSNEDNNKSSSAQTSSSETAKVFDNNYCIDDDLVRSNSIFQLDENSDDDNMSSNKKSSATASKLFEIENNKWKLKRAMDNNLNDDSSSTTATTSKAATLSMDDTVDLINLDNYGEEFDEDITSLIKFSDGVGYIKGSHMHFQYNSFGLIEVMEPKEYKRYINSNANKNVQLPLNRRNKSHLANINGAASKNDKNSEKLYKCSQCKARGGVREFYTPDFCCVVCLKQMCDNNSIKNIHLSTESVSSLTPPMSCQTTSDEENIESSLSVIEKRRKPQYINKNKYKSPIPKSEDSAFSWENYLGKDIKLSTAPLNLFINPYPSSANRFKLGMKMEAIDPKNNSLFCVCTVEQVVGFRIQLVIDGYSKDFAFWVNADSIDIFPPDWCRRTHRTLTPPKKHPRGLAFNWSNYLKATHSVAAPREYFTHLNSSATKNPFQIGMKLEAENVKNSKILAVGTVTDVLDSRILVHFDGFNDTFDHWFDITSPLIHPINYYKKIFFDLRGPRGYKKQFIWSKFLKETNSAGATEELFCVRAAFEFKPNMKLEVVDIKNRALIRPATVVDVGLYEIKVLFDGWRSNYMFWIDDDSPDIHPINWCKTTGHPIELPPNLLSKEHLQHVTCTTGICMGLGNYRTLARKHSQSNECPYDLDNWNNDVILPERTIATIAKERSAFKRKIDDSVPPKIKTQTKEDDKRMEKRPKLFENDELKIKINIARHLLKDYGPQLRDAYTLWSHNSHHFPEPPITKKPSEWTVEEVVQFVEQIPNCATLGNLFRSDEIDGAAFICLKQNDLTEYLNIKLGPAIKIYNRILHLRELLVTKYS